MLDKLTTLERISMLDNLLDQLAEAKGRERCGIICVMADAIKSIRNDVLILEEKVKDQEPQPEVKFEIVPNVEEGKEEA